MHVGSDFSEFFFLNDVKTSTLSGNAIADTISTELSSADTTEFLPESLPNPHQETDTLGLFNSSLISDLSSLNIHIKSTPNIPETQSPLISSTNFLPNPAPSVTSDKYTSDYIAAENSSIQHSSLNTNVLNRLHPNESAVVQETNRVPPSETNVKSTECVAKQPSEVDPSSRTADQNVEARSEEVVRASGPALIDHFVGVEFVSNPEDSSSSSDDSSDTSTSGSTSSSSSGSSEEAEVGSPDSQRSPPSPTSDEDKVLKMVCKMVLNNMCYNYVYNLCLDVRKSARTNSFELDNVLSDDDSQEKFDIFGNPAKKVKPPLIKCPVCSMKKDAGRFTAHLDKCNGGGRNSSRIAKQNMEKNYYDNDSDFGDDDDLEDADFSCGSKKRMKKKQGATHRGKILKNKAYDGFPSPEYQTYTYMTLDEKRAFLNQSCGVISKHTKKICQNSLRCKQHTDEQKMQIRDQELKNSSVEDQDICVDLDSSTDEHRNSSVLSETSATEAVGVSGQDAQQQEQNKELIQSLMEVYNVNMYQANPVVQQKDHEC